LNNLLNQSEHIFNNRYRLVRAIKRSGYENQGQIIHDTQKIREGQD
jgi:hypothetical protein